MMAESKFLLDADELWKLQESLNNKSATASSRPFEYIQWSWCDINDIARGVTIPAVHAKEFMRTGYSAFAGSIAFGHVSDINEAIFDDIIKRHGVENCDFVPATPRVYSLPWANSRTAGVICEAFWQDGSPLAPLPRFVARRQVENLAQMGYKLSCAFESEFTVLNPETMQLCFAGCDYASHSRVSSNSAWLYEIEKYLRRNDIDVRSFHAEYSPSQFEFTFMPRETMVTLDNMYIYGQAVKEIPRRHGKLVSFMTKIFNSGACNSSHFNHSLQNKEGRNLFWDPSKPDNLSDIGRHWIGGTVKHLHALTALCCPTVNCYRRLHTPIVPTRPNWSIDDRHMAVRVVNKNESSMRVENRLPSSACNPYLAAAAIIAAGIDGIKNKIEPPPVGMNLEAPDLPHSLDEALKALEEDAVICEALGEEFIAMFMALKRGIEIKAFKDHDMKSCKEEEFAAEREKYLERFEPLSGRVTIGHPL